MGEDPSTIRQEIRATRGRMGDTVEALSYKTDVKARAKDAVYGKKHAMVNMMSGLKEAIVGTASDAGGSAAGHKDALVSTVSDAVPSSDEVRRKTKEVVGVAQENPLGLAIGAAAIGFVAALLIPSTRIESEKIGAIADQAKDTVRTTGQQALEHGKKVAQDVVETATETAKQSGEEHRQQMMDNVAGNGQEAVSNVQSGSTY